jgi:serine phosphatase RsbU (regulator of sigma subunit)
MNPGADASQIPSPAVEEKAGFLRGLSLGQLVILAVFGIAVLVFLFAPFAALSWIAKPFTGFLVEHTLVGSSLDGYNWNAGKLGITYPQRVIQLGDAITGTSKDYQAAVDQLSAGEAVTVRTILPDGSEQVYPGVEMMQFSTRDLVRLFWLPYIVGLAFLIMGMWIYRLRGHTAAGQAFAFFCGCASIASCLLFDQVTTHAGPVLWTLVIAQQGAALISLAMVFPETWKPLQRRIWLRYLPYVLSIAIAIWGISILYNQSDPWAYVSAWKASYYFTTIGVLIFLGVMLYQMRTNPSAIVRQQTRIVLWGSAIAFIPLGAWMVGPLFGFPLAWNPAIFMPLLLVFLATVALAIQRYHLWEIDYVINRTLVYGMLTILLALIYYGIVFALQYLFQTLTGNKSDFAAVASTLVIVALFIPLRRSLQVFIDRRFYRSKYDTAKTIEAFSQTLRDQVDLNRLIDRVETVIWQAIMPTQIHTWLSQGPVYRHYKSTERQPEQEGGSQQEFADIPELDPVVPLLINASGTVDIEKMPQVSAGTELLRSKGAKLAVPLITQGKLIGWLSIGPRLSEQEYSPDDSLLIARLAAQAAPAVRVAQLVAKEQAEALEKERLQQEMSLARRIQLGMLPSEMPVLKDWCLADFYQPARNVGGDFYDFIEFEDGQLGFFIGDVTGKGMPAALLMATTRTLLRAMAQPGVSPGKVLQRVNSLVKRDITANMFITCLYGILDSNSGYLVYANAGQNLPMRLTERGVMKLHATGVPLGLMEGIEYEECEAVLEPEECILFYSDGLVEAHNPKREMFGDERVQSVLSMYGHDSNDLINGLLSELKAFTGPDWEQEDDITLVGIKRESMPEPSEQAEAVKNEAH